MDPGPHWLSFPTQIEVWLMVAYGGIVLLGARAVEAIAQIHFVRAERQDHQGFEYVEHADHYRCQGGQHLYLHVVDTEKRRAVYRAHASGCTRCSMKASCAPHDDGRHLFRSLVPWAETDVGRFHRRVSAVMFGACGVLCGAGFLRWIGEPGSGYLLMAVVASMWSLGRRSAP